MDSSFLVASDYGKLDQRVFLDKFSFSLDSQNTQSSNVVNILHSPYTELAKLQSLETRPSWNVGSTLQNWIMSLAVPVSQDECVVRSVQTLSSYYKPPEIFDWSGFPAALVDVSRVFDLCKKNEVTWNGVEGLALNEGFFIEMGSSEVVFASECPSLANAYKWTEGYLAKGLANEYKGKPTRIKSVPGLAMLSTKNVSPERSSEVDVFISNAIENYTNLRTSLFSLLDLLLLPEGSEGVDIEVHADSLIVQVALSHLVNEYQSVRSSQKEFSLILSGFYMRLSPVLGFTKNLFKRSSEKSDTDLIWVGFESMNQQLMGGCWRAESNFSQRNHS